VPTRRLLGLTTAIVVVIGACTATPAASEKAPPTTAEPSGDPTPVASTPSVSPPASAAPVTELTASADGYTLTVTADRETLAVGEVITFVATFRNDTSEAVDFAPTACPGAATGVVHVPLPSGPAGRTWSGIGREFKDYVLTKGMGPGIVPALDPVRRCASEPTYEPVLLQPGDSVTNTLSWRPELVRGVDAMPGPVPFEVSVAYDQQNAPPSYPPDYEGPLASWSRLFKLLSVSGSIEVTGDAPRLASPGEVVDTLLADRKFSGWLAKQPSSTWSNANLFLTSSSTGEGILPKGPSWEIDLFREMGVPRHWAIAFVDPFDAGLLSVTYCNIPCGR
jgi:hypothetical protein